jgi:hypothetical protein
VETKVQAAERFRSSRQHEGIDHEGEEAEGQELERETQDDSERSDHGVDHAEDQGYDSEDKPVVSGRMLNGTELSRAPRAPGPGGARPR